MTGAAGTNIHATAIVIRSRGLLFIGPSASGKSSVALSCLMAARDHGLFAALIADDQVFVSTVNGRIVARRPSSIAGFAELRGAGIVAVASLPSAVLDCAILPVQPPFGEGCRRKPRATPCPMAAHCRCCACRSWQVCAPSMACGFYWQKRRQFRNENTPLAQDLGFLTCTSPFHGQDDEPKRWTELLHCDNWTIEYFADAVGAKTP